MSPLLRDNLHVLLTPSRVLMARSTLTFTRRGLVRHLLANAAVDCAEVAPAAPVWDSALQVLDQRLPAMCGVRANLHVTLSSQFARYAIVPWQAGLHGSEDKAYVRHYFSQMFGSVAEVWDICAATAQDGEPRLASAIDAALLLELRKVCERDAVRLKSLQPQLARTVDHCRRRLPASGWIVLAETGHICIGLFVDGRWLSVQTLRTGADWLQELPLLLAREACLANLADEVGEVFLWAPGLSPDTTFPAGRFRFHALPAPDVIAWGAEQ